jgi:ABC-type multidrug transport system ATPase subunit
LIHGISTLENIMLPAFPTRQKSKLIKQRAVELLEKLKILSKARERVEHLSGGELQRVAIARALINDPDFLIADEPTAHLNTDLAMKFLDIMDELRQEGKTIMIASHDPLLYESDSIDWVIELRDGRIVAAKCRSGKTVIDRSGFKTAQRKTNMIDGSGNDRCSGNNGRSGNDRRTADDRCASNLVWLGTERRTGIDRRSGKERRCGS